VLKTNANENNKGELSILSYAVFHVLSSC